MMPLSKVSRELGREIDAHVWSLRLPALLSPLSGQYTAFSYSHPLINPQERATLMHDEFIVNAKGLYRPVPMPSEK